MSVPCPKPFSPLDLLQLGNQLAKYTGPTNQVTYARVTMNAAIVTKVSNP